MKTHIFSRFLLGLLMISNFLSAEIVEIDRMKNIHQYVKQNMLIIFDIDNTLIEPVQELGSNQWFTHRIKEYCSYGLEKSDALEKALKEWSAIQSVTEVKIVEQGTSEIIENLQLQGITIIGMTTRGLGLSTRTIEQLESVDINLSLSAPTKEEIFFMNEKGVLFRGGVLFTAGTHKGNALPKLLDTIGYHPSEILYINDKKSNLVTVEEMCEKEGIAFTGLRYSFLDKKVKNFRKQIAEEQFYFFGHILSDAAAERILHESK